MPSNRDSTGAAAVPASPSLRKSYPTHASDYELKEEIGQGATATCWKAKCLPLNEIVAVKCLDLEKCNSSLEDIRKEAQMMGMISHPNLVRSYCSFTKDQFLWVVMPLLEGGSCLHIMKSQFPNGLEEAVIATILRDTLIALDYLHHHGHIHRDVKAGNILLSKDGNVALADFGVSAYMFDTGDRQHSRKTFVGTPCWMAPEVLEQQGYDFKADIWSFGITALELAHGHAPFDKFPPMKVLMMTLQGPSPGLAQDKEKKFSKSFKEMVAMCLLKDPTKRPSAEKLLKHPFFKHSKNSEFLVKKLLQGLPPLEERVRMLELKEEARMAAKKTPMNLQEEHSQTEYKLGVSGWNFDVADLKKQAALIPDDDDAQGQGKGQGQGQVEGQGAGQSGAMPTIPEGSEKSMRGDGGASGKGLGAGDGEGMKRVSSEKRLSESEGEGGGASGAGGGRGSGEGVAKGSGPGVEKEGKRSLRGIGSVSGKMSADIIKGSADACQVKGRFKIFQGDDKDDDDDDDK